ncbi:MAG: PKD domain-containing protein [Nanoarchaeota archaeon]|nr:PKD domain-containing protein [Nanoarchaeota archaeon]
MKKLILIFIILFQLILVRAEFITITVNEGDLVSLKPEAVDEDMDNIVYNFSQPLNQNGEWQTGYDDAGEYKITVTASDGRLTDTQEILLIVKDKDRAPFFEPLNDAFVNENEQLILNVTATDPDGDKITYLAIDLPDNANFVNNKFSWAPGFDIVKKNWLEKIITRIHIPYRPKRNFFVTFIAKSNDLETKHEAKITVYETNRAPVLEKIGTITVNEGETLVLEPNAADPDGDILRYSYSGFANKKKHKTGYDEAGTYYTNILASDGYLSDSENITLIIKDTNRAPILKLVSDIAVDENKSIEFKIYATDPDGDNINFLVENAPNGSNFVNQTFSWMPDFDTVDKDKKDFTLTFIVNDGKIMAKRNMTMRVYDKNRAPIITNTSPEALINIYKNKIIDFKVIAHDLDNNNLTYTWRFGVFEKYTGTNTHRRRFTIPGTKPVQVMVSDGIETKTYGWTVNVIEPEEEKPVKPVEKQIYRKYTIEG